MSLPIVALTLGDPAGIGPEIIMKALASPDVRATCRPLVIGDAGRLRKAGEIVGSRLHVESLDAAREASFGHGDVECIDLDLVPADLPFGQVSRVAGAEDSETRTMRVEIDLSNKEHLLRDGMYGKVTIQLEKPSKGLTVPSAALAGELEDGQATLYVARGGIAKKLKVRIGADDGIRTEVLSGLQPDDEVILTRGSVADGVKVIPVRGQGTEQAKAGHH